MNNPKTQINKLLIAAQSADQNGDNQLAINIYEKIYELIPDPKETSELTTLVLCNLGNLHYFSDQKDKAFEDYSDAVKCKNGLGDSFIHLRLGQLQFERGNFARAEDELMRAYMSGGQERFAKEDPKYFELIKKYT